MNERKGAVLVTGASSGMGRACVQRLADAGWTVFAGVRKKDDAERIEREGPAGAVPVMLDVTEVDTISSALETIERCVGASGLSGLVNNAGVGVTSPIELVPLEALRRQLEINVVGQVAVMQAMLPLIRRARGRIINVGSVGARFPIPFGGPLCASKSAIETISETLRMELRPWGIRVIVVAPGSIKTPAVDKLAADSRRVAEAFPDEGKRLYRRSYLNFVDAFLELENEGVDPMVMAEVVRRALTAQSPRKRYAVGPKSRLLPFLGVVLPAGAADVIRTKLFHVFSRFGSNPNESDETVGRGERTA